MGRPINKRYLGDALGSIKVSHYFRVGGAETAGEDDTYIVSQRSSNKFLIADASGGWSEVLTLVDKDAGTLAEGEFRISATDELGADVNAIRLYNRTVRVTGPKKVKWSVDAAELQAITGITQSDPAVVTVADTSVYQDGDVVSISGVVGMTEINGLSSTITILDATTFELDTIDSTGFTAYTSGGTVSESGSIDDQDA